MKYNYKLKKDIIAWDIVNWWKFIKDIENQKIEIEGKNVLDLGACGGGLSLFLH